MGASTFRWSNIAIPLAIFSLSIIITVFFYHRLHFELAYHFNSDGSPDRWLSREAITIWFLVPQLILTGVAVAVTWGADRLSARFRQPDSNQPGPEKIIPLMGNMIALPQIIFSFAMLDIFSYNSYRIHLMPLWVFAVIVMGLGIIILGVFFVRVIRRVLGN